MPETEQKVKYCPNCGGAMEFHISKQKIACKYCSTELDLEPVSAGVRKQDFSFTKRLSAAQEEWDNAIRVLTCERCGAEVAAAANLTSVSCRYCGSSQMLGSRRKAGVAPEALMPFRVPKHDAAAIFSKWIKRRFFAPKAFRTLAQTDQLTAVYSPFWTFDASASGSYTGEGGKHHQETYQDKDGKTRTRTKTIWHHVSGFVSNTFRNILIYAGQAGAKLLGGMKTFDVENDLIPFESDYLAGFQAETYTVSPEQGFEQAKEKMMAELKSIAERQIRMSYDDVRGVRVDAIFANVKFMHILLPVWFSGFTYEGKNFSVTINGATGEIRGAYPKSAAKIAIVAGIAVVLVAVIVFLISRANA